MVLYELNFLLVHIATDSTFVALLAGFVERRFISFLLYCIVLYCIIYIVKKFWLHPFLYLQ